MLLRIRMTATRLSRLRSATIISMIWRRRATRSASSWVASSASGRKSGLVASTKRAIMLASIGSVFARRPSAWAKWRTCAGLTTTTGSEAPASAAATTVSKPPVASTAIRSGPSVPMRSTSSVRPLPSRDNKGFALRQNVNVEPILRHVDPDIGHFHLPPSLRKRALAAQATVRGRWTNGGATRLRRGLKGPRTSRRPLRYRALNPIRRRENQVTRMRNSKPWLTS